MLSISGLRNYLVARKMATVFLSGLAVIVAATFVLRQNGLNEIFWSESKTLGQIYADSPEIYTRERLVNDRSIQDGWLKLELKKLDDWAPKPQTAYLRQQIKQLGNDLKPADWDRLASLAQAEVVSLAPVDEFKIRDAARELIRQEIIENQLDDRHDLAGNTMFMLKIDAAVIPGTNTTASAVIEATVKPPNVINIQPSINASSSENSLVASVQSGSQNVAALDKLYGDWLDNINRRLNERAAQVYLLIQSPSATKVELARFKAFEKVVTINGLPEPVLKEDIRSIPRIPCGVGSNDCAALFATHSALEDITGERIGMVFKRNDAGGAGKYIIEMSTLRVGVSPSGSDVLPPEVTANSISHSIWYMKDRCASAFQDIQRQLALDLVSSNGDKEWTRAAQRFQLGSAGNHRGVGKNLELYWYGTEDPETRLPEGKDLHSALDQVLAGEASLPFSQSFVDYFATKLLYSRTDIDLLTPDQTKLAKKWDDAKGLLRNDQTDSCFINFFNLLTGKIEFVRRLLESSSFTYAVLPKYDADIDVIESGSLRQLDLKSMLLNQPEESPINVPSLGVALRDQERQIRSRVRLIGYGVRSSSSSEEVDMEGSTSFGWIMQPGLDVENEARQPKLAPIQKSLSALVSVPVWWTSIKLEFKTGWIDSGDGRTKWNCVEDIAVGSGPIKCKRDVKVYSVRLPTDWASIDDLVLGDSRRFPRIEWLSLPDNIDLYRCRPAQLEIPGYRLWRSTVVTLGGQQADKITVLPNMRGVLAEFNALTTSDPSPKLHVWTSEGVAEYPGQITLKELLKGETCSSP